MLSSVINLPSGAVWRGTPEELSDLMVCIKRSCSAAESPTKKMASENRCGLEVPAICSTCQLLREQKYLDHLLFARRNLAHWSEQELDESCWPYDDKEEFEIGDAPVATPKEEQPSPPALEDWEYD